MVVRPSVAIVGSVNTDLVVFAPRLPGPGQTVVGGDLLTGGGGKGANQAVAVARLGGDARFVGRVGDDDLGRAATAGLAEAGVDVSELGAIAGVPSGVALIVVDHRGENLIAVAPGANHRLSPADVDAAWPTLPDCRVLLLQLEIPLDTTMRAAERARADGKTVILNPAPTPETELPADLFRLADVVVPNEVEAAALTGIAVDDAGSARRAAEHLLAFGSGAVVVTLGAQGALLVDGDGARSIPTAPVEAVDTTAAGDAFCGGLAFALARGDVLADAARFAACVAAAAVTRPGAQASMPALRDVQDLQRRLPMPSARGSA